MLHVSVIPFWGLIAVWWMPPATLLTLIIASRKPYLGLSPWEGASGLDRARSLRNLSNELACWLCSWGQPGACLGTCNPMLQAASPFPGPTAPPVPKVWVRTGLCVTSSGQAYTGCTMNCVSWRWSGFHIHNSLGPLP